MASAAPSVGSVPEPSSSKSTRDLPLMFFRINTILDMCDENVDRLSSMLCSSPISASTLSKTQTSEPLSAGIGSPAIVIRTRSPHVLRDTVLPPVLGPVTIRAS